jgi:hypothetical protein
VLFVLLHQDEGCALTNLPRPARWYPRGDAATSATKVARSPPRIKPMEGFFMSKEPRQKGRVTYHGFVPDTDPRYGSGWNFLTGKNLNLLPVKNNVPAIAQSEEPMTKDRERPE